MPDNLHKKDFLQVDKDGLKKQKDDYALDDMYKTYSFSKTEDMSKLFDYESENLYKTYSFKMMEKLNEASDDELYDTCKKDKPRKKKKTKKSGNTDKNNKKHKIQDKNNKNNDSVNDKTNSEEKEIESENEYTDFNTVEIDFVDFNTERMSVVDFDNTLQYGNDEIYLEENNKATKKSLFNKKIIIIVFIILGLLVLSIIPIKKIIKNKNDYNTIKNKEEYFISDSDKRYLSEDEIRNYTIEELGYIRNEIFARHGYVFGENKYKDYFESQTWYEPDYSFKGDTDRLNKYEIDNINLLLETEKKYKE